MKKYIAIVGDNIKDAFKKGTNMYIVSGKNKTDAIINLSNDYPSIDKKSNIYLLKLDCIDSIYTTIDKAVEKESKKLEKKIKKDAKKSSSKKIVSSKKKSSSHPSKSDK